MSRRLVIDVEKVKELDPDLLDRLLQTQKRADIDSIQAAPETPNNGVRNNENQNNSLLETVKAKFQKAGRRTKKGCQRAVRRMSKNLSVKSKKHEEMDDDYLSPVDSIGVKSGPGEADQIYDELNQGDESLYGTVYDTVEQNNIYDECDQNYTSTRSNSERPVDNASSEGSTPHQQDPFSYQVSKESEVKVLYDDEPLIDIGLIAGSTPSDQDPANRVYEDVAPDEDAKARNQPVYGVVNKNKDDKSLSSEFSSDSEFDDGSTTPSHQDPIYDDVAAGEDEAVKAGSHSLDRVNSKNKAAELCSSESTLNSGSSEAPVLPPRARKTNGVDSGLGDGSATPSDEDEAAKAQNPPAEGVVNNNDKLLELAFSEVSALRVEVSALKRQLLSLEDELNVLKKDRETLGSEATRKKTSANLATDVTTLAQNSPSFFRRRKDSKEHVELRPKRPVARPRKPTC